MVQSDAEKMVVALFTRKRGLGIRNQIRRAQTTVGDHAASINQEATQWLGIWLGAGLTLKTHYHRKAPNAEGEYA